MRYIFKNQMIDNQVIVFFRVTSFYLEIRE